MSHIVDIESGIARTASGRESCTQDGSHDCEPQEELEPADQPEETSRDQVMPFDRTTGTKSPSPTEADIIDRRVSWTLNSRRHTQTEIEEVDKHELKKIITKLSQRQSFISGAGEDLQELDTLAELHDDDPGVNPAHKDFDLYKWLRLFMHQLDAEGIKSKHAGVVYRNLSVWGSGAALQLQETVGSYLQAPLRLGEFFSFGKKAHKQILHDFSGIMKGGELLIVLGRPGSGCSTLLKAMCGQLHGISIDEKSTIHYKGIPQKQMLKEFRGELVYNQEVDKHFPHLTVGQTLEFAASVRTPSHRIRGVSRDEYARHIAQVVMAVYGLSHTYNTKVGDDYVRGVSGGERKRVSIAEMAVAGSSIGAWDNSTRGLDSATALKFVQSLRLAADLGGVANAVAIYQASEAIYDAFDRATVLYEGRQIYFGPAREAKAFFERQGWFCPQRQTTSDFLTSVTNAGERRPREGMEEKVPRTPEDFEQYWRQSPEYKALQDEIDDYEHDFPISLDGPTITQLRQQKNYNQAKLVRPKSPYMISIPMQIQLNTKRAYQRIWNDISATLTTTLSNVVMALIVGSIFYGTPESTAGFFAKGSVLFFAILLNALTAISEINSLYSQRAIVEKHASYAFYHPATEAVAGIVADIPIKFALAVAFNLVLYFMTGLRREPAQFFLYFLVTYTSTFVMSATFRTMAAVTRTISQAMSLAGVLVLALVNYTGYAIAPPQMRVWFGWIRWVNPIFYAFEILVANEYHGREFSCPTIVPAYTPLVGESWICSVLGAKPGRPTVSGDDYIAANYEYYYSHVWRNFGILILFLLGFMIIYFAATELNSSTTSVAEVLVFQRGHVPANIRKHGKRAAKDVERAFSTDTLNDTDRGKIDVIPPQKDIFTWRDIVYDIPVRGETRRLLDHVSGWVKPGTLTALMGASGAGKTTLLNVLAQRTDIGVIGGGMFVNGKPLDASFQRKTGYVQQQDLHLETATVRESLRFSAMLRQPKSVSKEDKYEYVEDVIKMLDMEDFANAVVGIPGEGLNVEQRKLLTIGVELAAKPKLLLFLDEPTSGLDSQSSWVICAFLRKLAGSGQAVLCTIHQPSAILFQEFDRLLFLADGGKTVYFGNIGKNSRQLLDYYESNGARKCGDEENPAEYMLEIVSQGSRGEGTDWHEIWKMSQECKDVQTEIDAIHTEREKDEVAEEKEAGEHAEFAMPFWDQLKAVTYRVFQQYWRMPAYIFSRWTLSVAAGLFIGLSFFKGDETQAGMQSILFSVFMLTSIFSTIIQQIMPLFVTQRSLYEVRERPSKAYSWKAFLIANIVVEVPYQIVNGILVFACYYYPVVGVQSSSRQILVLLFTIQFFIYASAFAHMCIAALPDAQTAGAIATLLFAMSLAFCGVMQAPAALPRFWIFMYRVSPFTYWIAGIVATQLHGRRVACSPGETALFDPPPGQTCGQYLAPYLAAAPGRLQNPADASGCRYCALADADQFLAASNIFWAERWRNFGIVWAYVLFNVFMAVLAYYVFRVKRWNVGVPKKSRCARG